MAERGISYCESGSPPGAEQKAGKINSSLLKLTVIFQQKIKPEKYQGMNCDV